jgi:hypothetical protein
MNKYSSLNTRVNTVTEESCNNEWQLFLSLCERSRMGFRSGIKGATTWSTHVEVIKSKVGGHGSIIKSHWSLSICHISIRKL